MDKQKSKKKGKATKKAKQVTEKEPGLISNLDHSKVTNPFPPMKLGTGRHLAYISDTLFDDDLYN